METQNDMEDNFDRIYRRADSFYCWGRGRDHLLTIANFFRYASLSSNSYWTLHGNLYGGKHDDLILNS